MPQNDHVGWSALVPEQLASDLIWVGKAKAFPWSRALCPLATVEPCSFQYEIWYSG